MAIHPEQIPTITAACGRSATQSEFFTRVGSATVRATDFDGLPGIDRWQPGEAD